MTRRTQEQRRAATIGKLLEATIDCLAELGYGGTSTARICARAGVSQGALFNHFASRLDLVVAATERIGDGHVQALAALAGPRDASDGDTVDALVSFIRERARTPEHAAWHEVVVAARTDPGLCERVAPTVQRFEQALLEAAGRVLALDEERAAHVGMVLLSCMHMFDSEAVTTAVYPNAAIETARARWVAHLLRAELTA